VSRGGERGTLFSPRDGLVLVTGATGFVGGHVARALAASGYRVRGVGRREPQLEKSDAPIEWLRGDLREADVRARALQDAAAVVHSAGWTSLGRDHSGVSRAVNVDATRSLLAEASRAGVRRFVYTSSLWTVAAGTATEPADENSAWNLECVSSPYCDTKREAERLVLAADSSAMHTCVLCPGMVLGPRDVGPSSTRILLSLAAAPVALLPRGGIPVVDARELAVAHVRALEIGEPATRYVIAGSYVSYVYLASLVRRVSGRPRMVFHMPRFLERPTRMLAHASTLMPGHWLRDFSPATVSGGFLRLHVSGARANAAFGVEHPPPIISVYDSLQWHQAHGRLRGRVLREWNEIEP
jgi:nucleoside-diphosphate-sugar epimerase